MSLSFYVMGLMFRLFMLVLFLLFYLILFFFLNNHQKNPSFFVVFYHFKYFLAPIFLRIQIRHFFKNYLLEFNYFLHLCHHYSFNYYLDPIKWYLLPLLTSCFLLILWDLFFFFDYFSESSPDSSSKSSCKSCPCAYC